MIGKLEIQTVSLVTTDNQQMVKISYKSSRVAHLFLTILKDNDKIAESIPVAFGAGVFKTYVLLPVQHEDFTATAIFKDKDGNEVYKASFLWNKPREWEFYIMISSHTDIGLHNSQYIQRLNSSKFIDQAMKLCDETMHNSENDRYRYTVEGTWWWNNYVMDRNAKETRKVVDNYIKKGDIGVCCGIAGNHIQTYGLEEMCRSAYERKRLFDNWGIKSETLAMIDNNGLAMSMIQPYVSAGYKNIIFAPNQWNPLPSSIWHMDKGRYSCRWAPNAGGGGSRIDVSYDSEMPMVFWWEDENKNRILVWASSQYEHGCEIFGLSNTEKKDVYTVPVMEERISGILPVLEEKYPYNVWLAACYYDDQPPNLSITETIKEWNSKWKFPRFRTLGNPDKPFEILKNNFYDKIPVLKGDITGGWYQHPVSAAELLSCKFEADRELPTAEKWATVASLLDSDYKYPKTDFRHAWENLLYNDEHSYGTSGYQGRRVYETWMQHRDWIDKARCTAENELESALTAIASKIPSDTDKTVIFNPTIQVRKELVENDKGHILVTVPPMGYVAVPDSIFVESNSVSQKYDYAPIIENNYYRIKFSENGAIKSIFDKEQNKELLDTDNEYKANELVYTNDNHKTFSVPEKACFEVVTDAVKTVVIVRTVHKDLGCDIIQKTELLNYEKRIDIDNKIYHARDMINKNRYYRYIYFAYPFMVENARRYCHLNGAVAEYAKDVTGHGTDTYMAVSEWCCSENSNFGVALMMLDSQLIEFDRIHPDKTDFGDAGNGSQMFVYAANDWLQMHCAGGSHLDYRFRFSITSYNGTYKSAKIPQIAERYANPISAVKITKQNGCLDKEEYSFFDVKTEARLVCLKPAEDGNGIIARFYGDCNGISFAKIAGIDVDVEKNTVDECKTDTENKNGFATYRLTSDSISILERESDTYKYKNNEPAPIGSVYTGLVTTPRAVCGENSGHLYLLWGHNTESNFSHYKLYRSEIANFEANEDTFVADILPEEYVVGRYEDMGLKPHTCYYYKVCAVNQQGVCGEMSEEFFAFTKEEI